MVDTGLLDSCQPVGGLHLIDTDRVNGTEQPGHAIGWLIVNGQSVGGLHLIDTDRVNGTEQPGHAIGWLIDSGQSVGGQRG